MARTRSSRVIDSHSGGSGRTSRTGSAFHGAGGQAADQLLLEEEQQDHERERRDDDPGERDVDLVDARSRAAASGRSAPCGTSSSFVTSSGQRYWFHAPRNAKTLSAATAGRASGTATRRHEPPVPVAVERRRRPGGRAAPGGTPGASGTRRSPVARNGTARPWYVLYQPRSLIVARLVTIVISNGTINVARNTRNSVRLSGNSRNANA